MSVASTNSQAMLYSAESLKAVDAIAERLREALKARALLQAKRDGRLLATEGDVWEALHDIRIADFHGEPIAYFSRNIIEGSSVKP
jgi:hypothetical protein